MYKIIMPILLCLLTGCASNYWDNRRQDLTDVAHVDLVGFSLGATANISAISVGLFQALKGDWGFSGGRMKIGLGGIQRTPISGRVIILGMPLLEDDARSKWGYGKNIPHFASIGADIGFGLIGCGAHVDFLELLDFIFGFAAIDIVQDDKKEERKETIDIEEDEQVEEDKKHTEQEEGAV